MKVGSWIVIFPWGNDEETDCAVKNRREKLSKSQNYEYKCTRSYKFLQVSPATLNNPGT